MLTKVIRYVFVGFILSGFFAPAGHAQKVTLSVQANAPGKPISPDLFGIFFEDLNYVALEVTKAGAGVGLANPGFDGIAVKARETYDLSLFAHQLTVINIRPC